MKAPKGSSAVELLVVLAVVAVLVQSVAPQWVRWKQRHRLRAAAAELSLLAAALQVEAAASGRARGVSFAARPPDLLWQAVADGDGDGIRSADIRDGIDPRLGAPVVLARRYPGIRVGLAAGVRPPSGASTPSDGVALGRADLLSLQPDGTTSTGTVYLSNRFGDTAAVRFYGATGRRTLLWRAAHATSWTGQ